VGDVLDLVERTAQAFFDAFATVEVGDGARARFWRTTGSPIALSKAWPQTFGLHLAEGLTLPYCEGCSQCWASGHTLCC
jgi:hypothetical protein